MKLVAVISVVCCLLVSAVVADEAIPVDEASLTALVEAGVSLPNEFTICLKDRPMMCLAPSADLKQDGTQLILADRLRTAGQKFRLEGGVLHFADDTDRVISAEHGAQNSMDTTTGGRVWVWKRQELNFDQQWNANEQGTGLAASAQLCMRAFPKACLYTSYPAENKVIISNADHVRTLWVVRPIAPCGAANPCDSNAVCNAQADGDAKCVCNAGYSLGGDNKCFEVDLCANPATNPCDVHASCVKTGPAKASCTPHNGFEGKGLKGQVTPIDVCKKKPSPCDANSDCVSTGPALYKCTCKLGYIPTGPTTCAELDLCATNNPCSALATCTKTGPGKVACQCNAGFAGNGQQCTPVDGCAGTPCGEHATCTRTPLGGRQCTCDTGYGVDAKSKSFRCIEADACASKPCKGRNTYCKKTGPGQHKCLCNHGFLAFWNGNCEKPGSKEALEAAAGEGSESARQELIIQQRKVKEAEGQRKEMERAFRRKQKEREENIRALERRIRELIREKTNARINDRDTRIKALSERVSSLTTQQTEAQKTAALQLSVIKALAKQETEKVQRLEAAMASATAAIAEKAKAYAVKLRDSTRQEIAADAAAPIPASAPAPKPAPEPKAVKAPAQPPQYGNQYSKPPLKLPIAKAAANTPHVLEVMKAAAAAAAGPAPAPQPKAAQPVVRRVRRRHRRPSAHRRLKTSVRHLRSTAVGADTPRFQQLHAGAEMEAEAAAEAEADMSMEMDESAHVSVEAEVQRDLNADLAAIASQEVSQSDEDLDQQLAALHAEVDAHLDSVLASEHDVEENEEEDH